MIAETGLYLVIKFYVFSWNSQFRGFPLLNGLTLKGVLNQRTGTRRMEDAWRKRWHFARKVSSIENRTLFGKGVIFSNWDGFCSARHFQHGPSFWKSGKSKSTFFAKSRPVHGSSFGQKRAFGFSTFSKWRFVLKVTRRTKSVPVWKDDTFFKKRPVFNREHHPRFHLRRTSTFPYVFHLGWLRPVKWFLGQLGAQAGLSPQF